MLRPKQAQGAARKKTSGNLRLGFEVKGRLYEVSVTGQSSLSPNSGKELFVSYQLVITPPLPLRTKVRWNSIYSNHFLVSADPSVFDRRTKTLKLPSEGMKEQKWVFMLEITKRRLAVREDTFQIVTSRDEILAEGLLPALVPVGSKSEKSKE